MLSVDINFGSAIFLGQQVSLGLQDIASALVADGFYLWHRAVQAAIRDRDAGACTSGAAKVSNHQGLIGADANIHTISVTSFDAGGNYAAA